MPVSKFASQGALACARQIEAKLNSFPRIKHDDPAGWDTALRDVQRFILNEGGSFKDDWQGARVRLWGFTASSTSGFVHACRNWITQVRAKAVPPLGALS